MIKLLHREFTVDVPVESAWKHLANVPRWPSWAGHIRSIDLSPPGQLGLSSSGLIRLSNGMKSDFHMTEFNPPHNWMWVGKFLWLTIHYDHRFDAVDAAKTKLTWIVEAEGLGASSLGKLFAKIYAKNLDQAIPRLVEEMNTLRP